MRAYLSRRRLVLEKLETRNLLTAAVGTVELDGGVLSILGSNKNDQIQVSVTDALLKVRVNKQTFEFAAADVAELHIDGAKGNDRIWLDGSVLVGATIHGGAGNDQIQGGGGDDTISGDKGNDKVSGGGGNDALSGGVGSDRLWGDDGDDVVHGDEGQDHVHGGAGQDELFGDAGHDKLDGGDDDDVLSGGLGKDQLSGGAGHDQIFGDEGHDHLKGDDGDDQLFGGDGHDHLWGGLGDDRLKGEAGNDHLDGGEGDNLLDGDEGRNKFKNGTIVDLDQQDEGETVLIAHLTDQSGSGMVAEARYQISGDEDETVRRLTVTVRNVPSGAPLLLVVILEDDQLGNLTVDPATGEGSFTITGISVEAGDFIAVGLNLVGQFVAA